MYVEEDCGCGGHGEHHGELHGERQQGDCGCGGHRHGMHGESRHRGFCECGCHQHHGMGFHRHFVSREEVITRLEQYQKELESEAKAVGERIAELKRQNDAGR